MNINGYFIYNGVDTRTLGVDVSRGVAGNILRRPVREYQVSQPPGRLGDIIQDNRHFPNVEITYHVMIPDNFDAVYRQLRGALLGATGYARLEDSWNTEEFYQAYVSAPLQPTVSANRRQGMLEVTFNRRPERWLKSGEASATPRQNVLFAGTVPNIYPFFPKFTLECIETIDDTSPGALTVALVYTMPSWTQLSGLQEFTIRKTPRVTTDPSHFRYTNWNEYFVQGDRLEFDYQTSTLINLTQGTNLSSFLPANWGAGISPPGTYVAGDTGFTIYPTPSQNFIAVDFIPRWYAI